MPLVDTPKTLAHKIKKHMRDNEMSQSEFAKLVGTSQPTISGLVMGNKPRMRSTTLARVKNVLKGVPPPAVVHEQEHVVYVGRAGYEQMQEAIRARIADYPRRREVALPQRRRNGDKCDYPKCPGPVAITVLGYDMCENHWLEYCDATEVIEITD